MSPWAALVGNSKTGRNDALQGVVARLRAAGLTVGGVMQARSPEGQALVNLATGEQAPLATSDGRKDLCDWHFVDGAFAVARGWIEAAAYDVTVIPLARLEGQGRGHWPAAQAALARPGLVLVPVSPKLLPRYALTLPDPVAGVECPADDAALDAFTAELVAACAPA
ncbi:MAG: DUF2478 domain-containing protein [Myxococcales bacterium]|nr:DUF2478 domain-containing protein [Myxococcales bacterium]MCB9522397.1 DUF2478 domain-containing protein [Myxococcales bacterium]